MRDIYKFNSNSEAETENAAFNFAEENKIKLGDIIALRGDLGAGKTAFTRGLARFFSPESRVTSPTFSLVNQYKNIWHFDMYRINSHDDLLSIGFYDYIDDNKKNIIIIEWFEKIADFFDEHTVTVDILKTENKESEENQEKREIIFERRQ